MPANERKPHQLSIMSWNMHCQNEVFKPSVQQLDALKQIVSAYDINVLLLQECHEKYIGQIIQETGLYGIEMGKRQGRKTLNVLYGTDVLLRALRYLTRRFSCFS